MNYLVIIADQVIKISPASKDQNPVAIFGLTYFTLFCIQMALRKSITTTSVDRNDWTAPRRNRRATVVYCIHVNVNKNWTYCPILTISLSDILYSHRCCEANLKACYCNVMVSIRCWTDRNIESRCHGYDHNELQMTTNLLRAGQLIFYSHPLGDWAKK